MPFPFTTVCDLLQHLDNDHKRKRQGRGSVRITKDWFAEHHELIHGHDVDPVALLSTLLPERRTDRVFSTRARTLERIVSSACGLGSRKELLRRWETTPRLGLDFAECVEHVLSQSPNDVRQQISVEEVDAILHQLASTIAFSSPAVRSSRPSSTPNLGKGEHLLASLFRRLSPRDAKWFCRVVLKNFQPVVVPETTAYFSFHPALPDVMKIHDDLAVAVNLLKNHLRLYQGRGLSLNKADLPRIIKPQVGVKVGRQKWLKARGINHCLQMGQGWMSCEAKMDGEYCQIHIDLSRGQNSIQIFSKSGKDSTEDRTQLHPAIKASLGLGTPACKFQKRCILEGELVVYSTLEKKILGFEKIRKHVTRSGRYIGTSADSQPHAHEQLMIVYFDILLIDDDSMLDQSHSVRRRHLSSLVQCQEGRAAVVESRNINFSSRVAVEELREAFASCITKREEGLVLKPDEPYFHFGMSRRGHDSCCLKLKKGYIKGLGDVGDFAVVGARRDPTAAQMLGLSNIKFTHFYLGCLTNKDLVTRFQAKPTFKVVNEVQFTNKTIAKSFLRHVFVEDVSPEDNTKLILEEPKGIMQGNKMMAVFHEPAVFDMTCFEFHKESNCDFWSLRFPYISKIHSDRDWKDCVSFEELQKLAKGDDTRTDEDDSQELLQWIDKLEAAEPKRRHIAVELESQNTDTTRSMGSTTEAPQRSNIQSTIQTVAARTEHLPPASSTDRPSTNASAASPPARTSQTLLRADRSPRKRRRDPSPDFARNAKRRTEISDSTLSPTPQGSQRSLRQPLEDITSASSSQGNVPPASSTPLSRLKTLQEEPKIARSSPGPARVPNAVSFQRAAAFSSPLRAAGKTSNPVSTPTRPGRPSTSVIAPSCRHAGAACALADYFILLSPCVANMPLLHDTLLPGHVIPGVFRDIATWHASADLASSFAKPPPRLVLVEAKRKDETKEFLKRLRAKPLSSQNGRAVPVVAYDWRLIEAITELEQVQKRSARTGAFAQELWRMHFAGMC